MSTLVNKNITLKGRRTSLRLEPDMWEALFEICVREECHISDLCTTVDEVKDESSLTAAIRVFILIYFRNAASVDDHKQSDRVSLMGKAV
ncbi:hypothetical protein A9Q97_04285 [Rhodospirillales bacterium 47_12_T64]|nr:hypothetical protein A9Q97_04285 [Rhodospirillales bacterium 47_12_T64]